MIDLESPQFLALCNRLFNPDTRSKGARLYRDEKVLGCSVSHYSLRFEAVAKVQGTAAHPYDVSIRCWQDFKALILSGKCTCPMVENCKHVYAALLVAWDQALSTPQPRSRQQPPKFTVPPDAAPRASATLLPPPLSAASQLSPEWKEWLDRVTKQAPEVPDETNTPGISVDPYRRLLYVLKPLTRRDAVLVEFHDARYHPSGSFKAKNQVQLFNLLQSRGAYYLTATDQSLLRRIFLVQTDGQVFEAELKGRAGAELLTEIIATGRCYWSGLRKNSQPLAAGPPRPAKPLWRTDARGWQEPVFEVTPAAIILPLFPLWYVDTGEALCGPLETGLSPEASSAWLLAPKLSPDQSPLLSEQLPGRATVSLPPPARIEVDNISDRPPVPRLRLSSADRDEEFSYFDEAETEKSHLARLDFNYSGTFVSAGDKHPVIEKFAKGRLLRLKRDIPAERAAWSMLEQLGMESAENIYYSMDDFTDALTFEDEKKWITFAFVEIPRLQQQGWQIEIDPSFAFRLAHAEDWYADAMPDSGMDWFSAEIGVQVDGQKINLLPLLLQQFARNQDLFGDGALSQLDDNGHFLVSLPDGRRLPFPVKRLKMMMGILMDLFEPKALDRNGRLRLSKLRAAELSGATGAAAFRWLGGETLQQLNQKLRDFRSIRPVTPPAGLHASLRAYQQEGLNWLQFLREYDLAGILADDMGLGKTVQALAHLLEEKQSGRADRPSLVIAPTSLMTNWRQEAERFAPGLKLLILHGQERKQHFDKLKEYDVVVTSYPLLPRDEAILVNEKFHMIVLDEAQYIKNPKTKYAQIVCALHARHHVCLTGTPMENHLGELWSQFNFLLPGFLGNELQFRRLFRTPIEKGNDAARREILSRRIGPFVLRRRKEDVASELPPKTEIVQNVELSGAQRDLYETIRLAMHAKVQEEVRNKGMSRAHIIILDALLKLRQVCCDPRLVKLEAARKVTESAKLELLMDLVPEMLEEGRKILLFSQFTSMLALIQQRLTTANIPFVILTGQTTDRATPIQKFQSGEVSVFLISLKAGGTGLNLTAADTVIHYDPWWNPAVETQATDRAHRIGQTKSVFVYKLITVGTVEEKILALQDRKRGLVEGLLDEHRKDAPQLTADDLQVLFAPLG